MAKFKGNVTARYTFPLGSGDMHLQGAYVYQSSSNSDLSPAANALIGRQPAYGIFDVTAGLTRGKFNAELFVDNLFDKRVELYRFAECTIFGSGGTPICGLKPLANINTPRMIGLRFGERF